MEAVSSGGPDLSALSEDMHLKKNKQKQKKTEQDTAKFHAKNAQTGISVSVMDQQQTQTARKNLAQNFEDASHFKPPHSGIISNPAHLFMRLSFYMSVFLTGGKGEISPLLQTIRNKLYCKHCKTSINRTCTRRGMRSPQLCMTCPFPPFP